MNNIDIFPTSVPNPAYGLSGTPTFLVDTVELGDRNEKRIKRGINNKYYTWSLVWEYISENEMEIIRDFLEGLEGVDLFLWTHPTDGIMYKCACEEFNIALDVFERYTLSATFVEKL